MDDMRQDQVAILRAEIARLRLALTGIAACSTCPACRDSALQVLDGKIPALGPRMRFTITPTGPNGEKPKLEITNMDPLDLKAGDSVVFHLVRVQE